jgi:hypothetical protein
MRWYLHTVLFVATALATAQQALNNEAIVKMVKAGLAEELIVSTIQSQPGSYSLGADDLIALKSAGVSDTSWRRWWRRARREPRVQHPQ